MVGGRVRGRSSSKVGVGTGTSIGKNILVYKKYANHKKKIIEIDFLGQALLS